MNKQSKNADKEISTDQSETKERIFISAKREFSDKGFDGARMSAIARRANINQALIHYYFKSKENLYEQVLQRLFNVEQKTSIKNILDKNNLSPSQRLYIEIYFLVHLFLRPKDPEFERILQMQIGRGEIKRLVSIINKFFLPQLKLLENTIELGIKSGEFETHDFTFLSLELLLFVLSYEHFRPHFTGTQWHEHIYGEGYTKKLFNFLIEHTFKGLCPAGKKLVIPAIDKSLLEEVDKTIALMICETRGGLDE